MGMRSLRAGSILKAQKVNVRVRYPKAGASSEKLCHGNPGHIHQHPGYTRSALQLNLGVLASDQGSPGKQQEEQVTNTGVAIHRTEVAGKRGREAEKPVSAQIYSPNTHDISFLQATPIKLDSDAILATSHHFQAAYQGEGVSCRHKQKNVPRML